ncbi:hypothetical protein [Streptomyces sp. NPDC060243]|uniref:hypothetical protein n=1 Tax=Streptomyces sp. NPDC060243 TaxID=3347081 RepID=UPI003660F263
MPELLVRINGDTLPLGDCHWVLFTPNGCAYASANGTLATTPEQAHTDFTPRLRDRARQTRQGYHAELLSKTEWRDRVAPCFYGRCTHNQPTKEN